MSEVKRVASADSNQIKARRSSQQNLPMPLLDARALQENLAQLDVSSEQILIGLEATSRYGENLYHFLDQCGYHLCLLHPTAVFTTLEPFVTS
jgi:hypothetical protein